MPRLRLVSASRPPLPFAHQLYREKKFPRANSRDPSRAKMMAKKSRYQVKKGTDRQKKKADTSRAMGSRTTVIHLHAGRS